MKADLVDGLEAAALIDPTDILPHAVQKVINNPELLLPDAPPGLECFSDISRADFQSMGV